MATIIEPVQLLGATTTKIDKENYTMVANAEANAQIDKITEEIWAAGLVGININGKTPVANTENNRTMFQYDLLDPKEELAASSDSEQVVATIAPPIQSHVVAQIPAVDYNVDAPTAPKIIDHFVLSSHIKNPA